ncbi:MAG: M1 family metallopeptidase [Anaerolineae bacterium]
MLLRSKPASTYWWFGLLLLAMPFALGTWPVMGAPAGGTPSAAASPTSPTCFGFQDEPASAGNPLARHRSAMTPKATDDLDGLGTLTHYEITASVDLAALTLRGQATVSYTNRTPAVLSDLVFRLYANAPQLYGHGRLNVLSVEVAGQPARFELALDDTALRVPLSVPLPPGEVVTTTLRFEAAIPQHDVEGYGIFNYAHGVLALGGWYPLLAVYDRGGWIVPPVPQVGDAVTSEVALYDVALTVPVGVEVVASGRLVDVIEGDGTRTWRFVTGPMRDFAAAGSDRFRRAQTQVGATTINFYYTPAVGDLLSAQALLDIAAGALAVFNERFGPYPYQELDVVETDIRIGGYEYPGLVFVDAALRRGRRRADVEFLVAHEVAHQWWYGVVGNDVVAEPWLDEALAVYSTALYVEATEGPPAALRLLTYWDHNYVPDVGRHAVDSSALNYTNWVPYRSNVYYAGALFLDSLRSEIGDDAFFRLLRQHYHQARYRMATTGTFLTLAEKAADRDLDALYQHWFTAWADSTVTSTAQYKWL